MRKSTLDKGLSPLLLYQNQIMYKKNSEKDILGAAATAALGAGVVTSFAVSQGQHPMMALFITIIATVFTVICHQSDLI